MGAFNVVRLELECPRCRSLVDVSVQFKYGDTWQHEYAIGDELRWGGNDVGVPGRKLVAVDGVAESPCPGCGQSEWDLYVFVDDGKISRVMSADGTYDFVSTRRNYVVVEE